MDQNKTLPRPLLGVLVAMGVIVLILAAVNSVQDEVVDGFGFLNGGCIVLLAVSLGISAERPRLRMSMSLAAAVLSVASLIVALT